MKIKVITTFLLFCLIAGICYYISLPDYHVRNSMSFSNQGTRDTELTVIVYKYWGIDETIRKIETEHNKINGTPTTLERYQCLFDFPLVLIWVLTYPQPL